MSSHSMGRCIGSQALVGMADRRHVEVLWHLPTAPTVTVRLLEYVMFVGDGQAWSWMRNMSSVVCVPVGFMSVT